MVSVLRARTSPVVTTRPRLSSREERLRADGVGAGHGLFGGKGSRGREVVARQDQLLGVDERVWVERGGHWLGKIPWRKEEL